MNCPKCGSVIKGNESFCGSCGSNISISQSSVKQNNQEVPLYLKDTVFVDKDEKIVASVGTRGFITNWLFSDSFDKGTCILTDKRIYYKGKQYTASGGRLTAHTGESIVNLNEVTDASFEAAAKIWQMILGCVFCVLSMVILFAGMAYEKSYYGYLGGNNYIYFSVVGTLIIGLFFIAAFFLGRRQKFSVKYSGNILSFKTKNTVEDLRKFQRIILSTKAELDNKEN